MDMCWQLIMRNLTFNNSCFPFPFFSNSFLCYRARTLPVYLSQVRPTYKTKLTSFRTRWINWTHSRTQLKQALGKTIMRWWSYYRTQVAVLMVRSSIVPHHKWQWEPGTFYHMCDIKGIDRQDVAQKEYYIWWIFFDICWNVGRANQIQTAA